MEQAPQPQVNEEVGGVLMGCGSAKFDSLPVVHGVDTSYDVAYLQPLQLSEPCTSFVECAADTNVFAARDAQGRGWVWGNSKKANLPKVPTPLKGLADVVSVSVGDAFAVFVTRQGIMFAGIGLEEPVDQSTRHLAVQHSKLPESLERSTPVHVSACNRAAIVLCQDGSLFGIGDGITNGLGRDAKQWTKLNLPPASAVSVGSIHGAAVCDGGVLAWGIGLWGNLGVSKRVKRQEQPTPLPAFENDRAIAVSCTRGQPKVCTQGVKSGSEGPRMHVLTASGKLYIAGTAHKGLCADHLYKTFMPPNDQLSLYQVGGTAQDSGSTPVFTGGAEVLRSDPKGSAAQMGMKDAADYGKNGQTGYLGAVQVVSSQPAHIHSVALDSEGRVFCWGCGSNGRTGTKAFMNGPGGKKRALKCYISTPTCLETLQNARCLYVTSGRYWTLAIVRKAL